MKKLSWLKGIFPALVTPFKLNEDLDEEALRKLVNYLMKDVNGFVATGTTGEFVYLSEEERMKVIEWVVDEVANKKPVIAGTGASSTKQTIELTKYAKDVGAKAALVVTPYYFNPSYKEIYEHYEKLNELDFPIILYNLPQATGVNKEWWTVEGLAELENIVGIKDSSGNFPFLASLFEKVGSKISIICGYDEIGMAALASGADALILASANLIPDIWQDIYKAVQRKDLEKARALQQRIQKLVRIICRTCAHEAVKSGLEIIGIEVGKSRRPTMPGDAFRKEDLEELRIELENLGKIKAREIKYELKDKIIKTKFPAITQHEKIKFSELKVGEGFASPPIFELAHIDLLLDCKGSALELTIQESLKEAKEKLRIINKEPLTFLVPTVTIRTKSQEELVYNYAAEGVNKAIDASIKDGLLPKELCKELVILVNAFVHPSAVNKKRVVLNNYKAMRYALRKAIEGRPTLEELFYEKESARHPFRYTP
ncbi:MAG: 4-hydroxy-tetrahydrodipicolinate synthase [Candidatus Thermoplasmatota archaeon]|nr:4-hydroxy-tetrahydrodipicolinate synthase [Candidatus Thermoplasmatota archaeon]